MTSFRYQTLNQRLLEEFPAEILDSRGTTVNMMQ